MCWLAPGWWRLELKRPPPFRGGLYIPPWWYMILIFCFLLKKKKKKEISQTDSWWMSASSSSTVISMNEQQVKHITSRIAQRWLPSLCRQEGHTQLSPRQSSAREPVLASWPICSFVEKKKIKNKNTFSFLSWMRKEELAIAQHCSTMNTRVQKRAHRRAGSSRVRLL